MGLYDIMDEIAAKQVTKSETGDNRMPGIVVGVVQSNYSEDMPGRVCVSIPVRDAKANELKWARVAMPYSGSKWGYYFLPEAGDQVLVAFENGNIEKPYVIGSIPKDSNRFLTGSVSKTNEHKKIVTKNGSTFEFHDVADQDGQKDQIKIYTANKSHNVILDNEKGSISLSDKEGKNKLEIQTTNGRIQLKTEHKLTINVGDSVELTLNGDSGTIQVKCGKLNVEADQSVKLETSGKLGLSGGNVALDASASFKVNSSGISSIGGSPVKIG